MGMLNDTALLLIQHILSIDAAIAIDQQYAVAYDNRGLFKSDLGDKQGACSDYKNARFLLVIN